MCKSLVLKEAGKIGLDFLFKIVRDFLNFARVR